jgi:TPP-dependent trihydroxycyclohexane-1,2-dione (THcHDO) dehydratase
MKKRGLASPDNADALALTFARPIGNADQSWKFGRGARVDAEYEYDPMRYLVVGGVGSTVVEPSRSSVEVFSDDIFGAFRGPRYR